MKAILNLKRIGVAGLFILIATLLGLQILASGQISSESSATNATSAKQSNTTLEVTYSINSLGVVEVIESWKEMKMRDGIFHYFSATKENGIIPVRVENGKFTINFATRSYLRREEGRVYFATPDFYYEDSPLDITVRLHFPENLSYINSNVPPTSIEANTIKWELKDVVHKILYVEFDQVSPFSAPDYPTGPAWQVDPATLPELTADDIPHAPDEVLKEFEVIIKMMSAEKGVDPDLIRVLRKTLSKFYYMFAVYGLVKDFKPEGTKEK